MRVAFLAEHFLLDRSAPINGTQVQLYNLGVGFMRRGIEVHYICGIENLKALKQDASGISLHWRKPRKGPFGWILYLRFYRDKLNHINPDVVYQRGRSYLTYVAAKWARKNKKIFVWGSNGEDGCDFWKNFKRLSRSKSNLLKKALLSPNAILQDILIHRGIKGSNFVVNQTENQRIKLWINFRKKGIVIPSYFPDPPSELGQVKKEKIVLWLANLSPGKQPEIFIELARYCKDCDGWKFILAGGTDKKAYLEKIKEQAKSVKNIEMTGPIPFGESFNLFSRASLFINTSITEAEGVPNSFIQAWLSRTPVLSLNHDPNGWIKKRNLGWCAEGNPNFLFEKGKALLKEANLLAKMGDNCRRFAIDTFTTEKILDAYMESFSRKRNDLTMIRGR